MSQQAAAGSTRATDPRLARLAGAQGARAEHEIEFLVLHVAQPLIRSILSRYTGPASGLPPQEVEDLTATIHLRLVARLRALGGDTDPIEDFEGYVATLTYNAVNDHLRRLFPARTRLKNRLRYMLTHDPRLALWTADGVLVAGLRFWFGQPAGAWDVPIAEDAVSPAMRHGERTAEALAAIFEAARTPIPLDTLVAFTAALWQVRDVQTDDAGRSAPAPNGGHGVTHLEKRQYLRVLWNEIQQLPPLQRKALLLNLRASDSVNVISLIVLTGTAPFDELAAAVEMPPELLSSLWHDLPLDDRRIAAMLQVTRQQVINLRKSARQRLARRMSKP